MGCGTSHETATVKTKKRSSTKVTIDGLEAELADYSNIKKRYGHPSYYKTDGYEIGLKLKVKAEYQSFFVGTARSNGMKVTVKEFHTAICKESDVTGEIMILAKLSHDSIPRLKEVFITDISVYVVTDFVDSMRLKHFVDLKRNTTSLTHIDARKIVTSIISATAYCHSLEVIVRNITLDNITVKRDGKDSIDVKIADFSLATYPGSIDVLCDHALFDWNDVPYASPEALLGHPYGVTTDVWSIGVVLYTMISGELPFNSNDDKALVEQIKNASFAFEAVNTSWSLVDTRIKTLIRSMIARDAGERPQCADLLKSNPWILQLPH